MIHMEKEVQGLNSITANQDAIAKANSQNKDEIKDYDEKILFKELKLDK